MKALISPSLGPADNLRVEEVEAPAPGDGEVLVEIAYAGLNFFDLLIIEGKYQVRPKPPFSPGGEFSGRVAALGPGAKGFQAGDRVMGFCSYGAAAEQIAVPAARLAKIPEGLALDKAAGLSVAYGTSLHALKQRGEMKAGETLLVLGASGGVGLAAVEIGNAMGAKVIAGASSDEKLAFARTHGAAETINTAADDLRARLKELAPKGVDLVCDPVGGALTEAALRSLAWKGRLLVVGFASGEIPRPPLNIPLLKGCDIRGVYWGEFTSREPEAHRDNLAQLMDWAKSGVLSVHIHAAYPLEDYRQAFDAIAKRQTLGKTLLKVGAG
ncbi:MAG TPA: NADPH:quinone oxidoreductase family protein [Roseiarcus sp.]|nr:NADPH:quinone oxidoreductase family protein [Roseiarcus sp.]